jgi:hypothetical protein
MPARAGSVTGELLIPLLERKRLLDTAWIVSLVSALGPVALLWFLSILEVDLERIAWTVFVYDVAYQAVATHVDRMKYADAVSHVIRGLTIVSVVFLGALWHLVGGILNPMFLLIFTLPAPPGPL